MNIGIFTQSIAGNYGGILQNYALQQILISIGHTPITIDHYQSYSKFRWIAGRIRHLLKRGNIVPFPYYGRIGAKKILDFAFQNIRLTEPVRDVTSDMIDHYALDAIIVGSDQVWKPAYGDIGTAFLNFTKGYNIKRIAYAVSLGTDQWEFSADETEECKQLVSSFKAVSVRESGDVILCKEHLGISPQHVLDPTLLLHPQQYYRFCFNTTPKNYLFAYLLDLNQNKVDFVERLAASKRLRPIIMSAENNTQKTDSIENWLSLIKGADFVITDSYHGTLFSINFNREFVAINNRRRGESRFKSILNLIGENNRLISPEELHFEQLEPIDWKHVNEIISDNRKSSLDFLYTSLS